MASRPKGYGMTAELARKKDAKYDGELERQVVEWIQLVLGEEICASLPQGQAGFIETFKNGVYLCRLANALGGNIKFNEGKMAFKQMENIGKFLTFCENLGCNKVDLFQTVDLYEGQNAPQVLNGLMALGRKAHATGRTSYVLGPKEAVENKREFTEEQLRAGDGVIGLQMGSNKGASQAGQNFGKTRAIID